MTDDDIHPIDLPSSATDLTSTHKRNLVDLTRLGRQFGGVMAQAFDGMTKQGRGFNDVLRGIGQSMSKVVLDASFKSLGQSLGQALSGAINSALAGNLGSGLAFAKGGVLAGSTPIPFASGGVISSPIAFPLGRGTGIAGERGAEAILPLSRGPDGRLGVTTTGTGGTTSITFNVTTPDADSFRRSETQIAALLARTVARGQRNL